MQKTRWNVVFGVGFVLALALACNWSTANIGSLKITKDEAGKEETSNFSPGQKVYAIFEISNNPGKQSVKFRVLYDDVSGKKSGDVVQNSEKTLEVDGSRTTNFWIGLPSSGFANGRYKVEVTMSNENGEKKDEKSATFNVSGYDSEPASTDQN